MHLTPLRTETAPGGKKRPGRPAYGLPGAAGLLGGQWGVRNKRLVRTHTNLILEAVLQDWRLHVLPWEHEMVFDEPEEEEEDELEDSERR